MLGVTGTSCTFFSAGLRPDGSKKIRPVDDMSKSLVNAATQPVEKNVNNRLDELLEAARHLFKASDKALAPSRHLRSSPFIFARLQKPMRLWKADINSAFRRVPVLPGSFSLLRWANLACSCLAGHRQFAGVTFKCEDGEVYEARHLGMPFGSVASVHNWDRIGLLVASLRLRCAPDAGV